MSGSEVTRSSIRVLLASSLAAGLALLTQILAARSLGAEAFGPYALAISILALCSGIAKLGFDTSTFRFAAAYATLGQLDKLYGFGRASSVITLSTSTGIGLALVVASVHWPEISAGFRTCLLLVGCGLPLITWVDLLGSRMQALGYVAKFHVISGMVRPLVFLLVLGSCWFALGFIDASLGVVSYLGALLVSGLILHQLLARHWPSYRGPNASSLSEWFKVSLPLYAISISQLALLRIDTLIVGMLVDSTSAGLYWAASQLATIVSFGVSSINGLVAPRIAESYASNDAKGLRALLQQSSRVVVAYTLPVVFVLLVFGENILSTFGATFGSVYNVLLILLLGHMVTALCGPVGFLLTMTAFQNLAMWTICAAAAVNVALCYFLGSTYGLVGIASGTAIATAFRSALLTYYVRSRLDISR